MVKQKIILSLYLFLIYLFAFHMQSQLLLNWDVSWLMHASERMLNGGSYTNDFFELNPPLILYLYLPPVIFCKLTNISIVYSLQLYVFFIASISLVVCMKLCSKIFVMQSDFCVVITTIAAIFVLLPLSQFGQREHLLIMLTFPYLLLIICRLKNISIQKWGAYTIGVFSGIGFGVKPYFLLIPFVLELYLGCRKKKLFYFIREETISLTLVIVLYLMLIYHRHLDYLTTIIPTFSILYYSGFQVVSFLSLFNALVLFSICSLTITWIFFSTSQYKKATAIISIAALCCFAIYMLQKTDFYYHFLPMVACVILLVSMCYGLLYKRVMQNNDVAVLESIILLLFGVALSIFVFNSNMDYFFLYDWPAITVLACVALFYLFYSDLFTQGKMAHFFTFIFSVVCSFGMVIYVRDILQNDPPRNLLAILLSLVMLAILIYSFVMKKLKYPLAFLVLAGSFIFSWPVCWLYDFYEKVQMTSPVRLIAYLKPLANNKRIYIFSTSTTNLFPAVDYVDAIPVTRFAFMGWIPMAVKYPSPEVNSAVNFLNQLLIQDLRAQLPNYILVDDTRYKPYLGKADFNYLIYFKNNKQFQELWKHYHYVDTFEALPWYKFKVYEKM